ncbi:YebC/PmpR family DNA-binding transcriptional regulator [candidate division WWE3 bacterium]|nr:YebC/PmpR family DNA-binding transcriptional regulator [candidate division WWE3 bacterium]
MSGHSKWATIKRDKAVNDVKRSQMFTKISRLIMVAAKKGVKDPEMNPALRLAIEKARDARMPKENIQRAVDKGSGQGESSGLEEVVYEGYGPDGVAILVKALTGNRNRTVSEVRSIFSRFGGSLGESGSTLYIFKDPENPVFEIPVDKDRAQKLLGLVQALDNLDDVQDVYSNFVFEP